MSVDVVDGDQCVLGIDFGGTKIAVAVADAAGQIVRAERLRTEAERGASQALLRTIEVAKDLVAFSGRSIAAVGVATPGVVTDSGIKLAPNVPGWESLALASEIGEALTIDDVRVGNDVKAAALAELRIGALQDADPGLVVGLGTGVAAAVTIGGEVVEGAHGAAGELGYALPGGGSIENGAPVLEDVFSGRALDHLAKSEGLVGGAVELSGVELRRSASGGIGSLVSERTDDLIRHLVTCCLLLDPQRVVLFGGVAKNHHIRARLEEGLTRALPFPPEIVLSEFGGEAALMGAISMARERA